MLQKGAVRAMPKCKSCGAKIKWITTFAGKKAPVNAETIWFFAGEGNELFVTDEGAVIYGFRTDGNLKKKGSRPGHISHLDNCPKTSTDRQISAQKGRD